MFLAMVDDIAAASSNLADRLHNMPPSTRCLATSNCASPSRRLEIYAPLANRLASADQVRAGSPRLPLSPTLDYSGLKRRLDERGRGHADYIDRMMRSQTALADAGIKSHASRTRQAHLFDLSQDAPEAPLVRRDYDVIGIRILVDESATVYGVLGVIHAMCIRSPGEFDDYVATPKESMYQRSPHGGDRSRRPARSRFRSALTKCTRSPSTASPPTGAIKRAPEATPASRPRLPGSASSWSGATRSRTAEEFVESLKSDVFQDQIYCFTPKGDIFELPAGATPVDFRLPRPHRSRAPHRRAKSTTSGPPRLQTPERPGRQILTSKTKGPAATGLQRTPVTSPPPAPVRRFASGSCRQERDDKSPRAARSSTANCGV